MSVAKTCSGNMSFRHFKWPRGHSLLWQGLQGILSQITWALSDRGGVWAGSLEPKMATWGTFKALKINPEDIIALNYKGIAYYNLKKYEKSISCYN